MNMKKQLIEKVAEKVSLLTDFNLGLNLSVLRPKMRQFYTYFRILIVCI